MVAKASLYVSPIVVLNVLFRFIYIADCEIMFICYCLISDVMRVLFVLYGFGYCVCGCDRGLFICLLVMSGIYYYFALICFSVVMLSSLFY